MPILSPILFAIDRFDTAMRFKNGQNRQEFDVKTKIETNFKFIAEQMCESGP